MLKKERKQRDVAIETILIVLGENTNWSEDKIINRVATMFNVSYSIVAKIWDKVEL